MFLSEMVGLRVNGAGVWSQVEDRRTFETIEDVFETGIISGDSPLRLRAWPLSSSFSASQT